MEQLTSLMPFAGTVVMVFILYFALAQLLANGRRFTPRDLVTVLLATAVTMLGLIAVVVTAPR